MTGRARTTRRSTRKRPHEDVDSQADAELKDETAATTVGSEQDTSCTATDAQVKVVSASDNSSDRENEETAATASTTAPTTGDSVGGEHRGDSMISVEDAEADVDRQRKEGGLQQKEQDQDVEPQKNETEIPPAKKPSTATTAASSNAADSVTGTATTDAAEVAADEATSSAAAAAASPAPTPTPSSAAAASGSSSGGGRQSESKKRSERKRLREKTRREHLSNAFDELAAFIGQVEPGSSLESGGGGGGGDPSSPRDDASSSKKKAGNSSSSSSSGRRPSIGSVSDVDASGSVTRLDLIARALRLMKRLHRENEERKRVIATMGVQQHQQQQQQKQGQPSQGQRDNVLVMVPTLTPVGDAPQPGSGGSSAPSGYYGSAYGGTSSLPPDPRDYGANPPHYGHYHQPQPGSEQHQHHPYGIPMHPPSTSSSAGGATGHQWGGHYAPPGLGHQFAYLPPQQHPPYNQYYGGGHGPASGEQQQQHHASNPYPPSYQQQPPSSTKSSEK